MTEGGKPYQLNEGTILDGRYVIGRVLGEGGFGITYAGTNIRTGREAAIKEFFCLDYMNRANDGITAVLTDKDSRKRFKTERARFMKEARILGEFKDEPGVVTVLDYFEAGGTAYLVMEYLDGVTLHDYVKNHGAYDPKTFFEEIRPLMHTLAKVHEAGVIHRDISPDNIMRVGDGSVVLIDFGSAKDLSGRTVTTATTYKEGFAPPEQYASGRKLGPETDIYALAATFYYCLTGIKPESAIQRIMLDELRPIHELAGGIPDDIERMIAKGMSLMQTDRFSTVTDMEDIIEARYPLLTPEEKERIRKRKIVRRRALTAAAVILLALLTVNIIRNSTLYKMRMQDTQMVYLSWDGHEAQNERDKAERVIKNRLEVLAGKNNYLWNYDSKDDRIEIEIPASVLKGNEPVDLFRKYITLPVRGFTIAHADKEGNPVYISDLFGDYKRLPTANITKRDIEEVEIGEGIIPTGAGTTASLPYVRLSLKEPAERVQKEFLQTKGQLLSFLIEQNDSNPFCIPCFAEGDGRTIYLIPQESVDGEEFKEVLQNSYLGDESVSPAAGLIENESFRSVFKYDLENESAYVSPGIIAEPSVVWETPDNMLAGENQVTERDISGEAVLTEWECNKETVSESDWINTIVVLRKRLDSLGKPYAFGVAGYDNNRVAIKIAKEDINQAELLMLETNPEIYISDGINEERIDNAYLARVGGGEDIRIEISGIGSYDAMQIKELVDLAGKNKRDSLVVSLGRNEAYPVGRIEVAGIDYGKIESGRLPLTEFGIGGINEKDADAGNNLLEYINSLLTERSDVRLSLERVVIYDSKKTYKEDVNVLEIDGGFYPEDEEFANRMNKEMQTELGYEGSFQVNVYVDNGVTVMTLNDDSLTLEGFEGEAIKRAEYVYKKYDLEDRAINVEMNISNAAEIKAAGEKGLKKEAILEFGTISKNAKERAGEYGLTNYYVKAERDGVLVSYDEMREASALLEKHIRESDVFGRMYLGEMDVIIVEQ